MPNFDSRITKRFLFGFVVLMGFLLVFLIPPFQKTDEISHYDKTIAIATGNFFCTKVKNGQNSNLLPKSYVELPEKMLAEFVNQAPTNRFPKSLLSNELHSKTSFEKVPETVSCSLPFVFYLPATIVLAPLIMLGTNALLIFYIGRLCFFLFAIALFYVSKKYIPKKYELLLLGCLSLPMVLNLVSSYNKEVVHLGFGFLAFALLLSLKEKFRWPKFWFFVISLLLMIVARPQYLPFLGLLFFVIPKDLVRKASKPLLLLLAGVVFVVMCFSAVFLLPKIVQFHAPIINVDGVSAPLQIVYLEKFPLRFVGVLFSSYTNHMEAYYKSLVGTYGSIHFYLDWFIYTFYGVFILVLIYHYAKVKSLFSKNEFIGFAAILFCVTLTMFFSMYLYATPVGFPYVVDVQGRYFLVALPYMVLLCAQLVRVLRIQLLYIGFVLVGIFLVKNAFDRYYDFSAAYYHDAVPAVAVTVEINKPMTQILAVDPSKKLRGISFSVVNQYKSINAPFLLTIYDASCHKELRQTVVMTHINKISSYQDGVIYQPIKHQLAICYTLETLGGDLVKNSSPLFVQGDPKTKQPIAVPLYEY